MHTFDEWVGRATEALTLAGLILGPVWAWARKRNRKIDTLSTSVAKLARDVGSLKAEMDNNGGKSMRDIAERTEKKVTEMAGQYGDLATTVARLSGRFEEFSRLVNHQ